MTLSNLRLGPATLRITAAGSQAEVHGLPEGWTAGRSSAAAVVRQIPRREPTDDLLLNE
jgi:hypothetical protein